MKSKMIAQMFLVAGVGMVVAAASATAALVSYYNFDDGATVTDQVGSVHGTVVHNAGFSTSTPDGSASSLDLSATGVGVGQDYVRLGAASPDGPDFGIAASNSFTISMWVNYTASARGIVTIRQDLTSGGGDRSGVTFGINGATSNPFVGLIHSSLADDAANGGATFHDVISSDLTIATSTWTHMAASYDSGTDVLGVYVNGVAGASVNSLTGGVGVIDFVDANGSFTGFGAAGNGPTHGDSAGDFTRLFYDGLLDDVAIWDNALGADGIARLAGGESPLSIPEPSVPLLVLWAGACALFRRRR